MRTKEAAETLQVSERRVRALIKARLIKARKIGRDWYIDKASVEDRAARKPKSGGP